LRHPYSHFRFLLCILHCLEYWNTQENRKSVIKDTEQQCFLRKPNTTTYTDNYECLYIYKKS
jgi:hypothetical protein